MSEQHGPVSVGVSGLGRSGWDIHVKAIRGLSETFRVSAVFDPIAERGQQAKTELGAKVHSSFESLIGDPEIELVVVASPNRFHATQAQAALRAGKHVLCEKPFGLTLADVDTMIRESKRAGKILQPFQQRRFEPDFRKIQEVIASGVLGSVHFVRICWHGFKRRWDWQTSRATGGGTMNNNGPHLIDHALELFGDAEPNVWAEMKHLLASGDAEDHLKVILSGPHRPTVDIELTDGFAYGQDRWLVAGTTGGLRGDAAGLVWKWVDWSSMPPRPLDLNPTPDRSYNSETLVWQTAEWKPEANTDAGAGAAPSPAPVLELYAGLYRAIREGQPQVITPQSVRRRVAILEKVRAFTGQPLAIE
ncbi:MAG: Gfo/Idh/MocA family oxidoreductase [Kiritimatiellia bacterium]|nr:Gfo/Idh/MocA family oxidoreductase [Kiritimatiellia bacterium]